MKIDKLYVLKLTDMYKDKKCLTETCLDNSEITYSVWYTSKYNMSEELLKKLGLTTQGQFDCTFNHYTIIKQAYERGFETIGIMEDDISFKLSKNKFNNILSNVPEDFDIVRLCHCNSNKNNGIKMIFKKNKKFWGTTFYILNRKGMKYYIDYIDENFSVADLPLYDTKKQKEKGVNVYMLLNTPFKHNDAKYGISKEVKKLSQK